MITVVSPTLSCVHSLQLLLLLLLLLLLIRAAVLLLGITIHLGINRLSGTNLKGKVK
jgi:hypothetical protein